MTMYHAGLLLALLAAAAGTTCPSQQQQVPPCTCQSAGSAYGPGMGRIYSIAIGHDYGAHDYISEGGYITGFTKDVVREVCQHAGIQCRMVWDRYPNCWESRPGEHSYGGKGLLGRYYDGCIAWWQTIDRIHVFDFSMPYTKAPPAFFYIKKGGSFNPMNIEGKKLGFMNGWASDEKCVARHKTVKGHYLPKSHVFHVETVDDAIKKLNDNSLDAFFVTKETMEARVTNNEVDIVSSKEFSCFIAGNSMMTRKDNDLNTWWNIGYQKMRGSGLFAKMCADGRVTHGKYGPIDCLDG